MKESYRLAEALEIWARKYDPSQCTAKQGPFPWPMLQCVVLGLNHALLFGSDTTGEWCYSNSSDVGEILERIGAWEDHDVREAYDGFCAHGQALGNHP